MTTAIEVSKIKEMFTKCLEKLKESEIDKNKTSEKNSKLLLENERLRSELSYYQSKSNEANLHSARKVIQHSASYIEPQIHKGSRKHLGDENLTDEEESDDDDELVTDGACSTHISKSLSQLDFDLPKAQKEIKPNLDDQSTTKEKIQPVINIDKAFNMQLETNQESIPSGIFAPTPYPHHRQLSEKERLGTISSMQSINDANVCSVKLLDKVIAQNKYLNECVRDLLFKSGVTLKDYLDNAYLKDVINAKNSEIKKLKNMVVSLSTELNTLKREILKSQESLNANSNNNNTNNNDNHSNSNYGIKNNLSNIVNNESDNDDNDSCYDSSLELDGRKKAPKLIKTNLPAAAMKSTSKRSTKCLKTIKSTTSAGNTTNSTEKSLSPTTTTSTLITATNKTETKLPVTTSEKIEGVTTTTLTSSATDKQSTDAANSEKIKCGNCYEEFSQSEFEDHSRKCEF